MNNTKHLIDRIFQITVLTLVACCFDAVASAADATAPAKKPAFSSPFFDQVKANFAAWDLDHNGELSANEIELAVHQPGVKDEAAAAIAALRRGGKMNSSVLPITLEKLKTILQTKAAPSAKDAAKEPTKDVAKDAGKDAAKEVSADGLEVTAKEVTKESPKSPTKEPAKEATKDAPKVAIKEPPKELPIPKFESLYKSALEKIHSTNRELFVGGSPKIESISQGHLGDCFLIVSLGTCAYRDPDRLTKMMQPASDGKAAITLGGERHLEMNLPTDAEIAIGATTRNTGIWAAMYEQAIGDAMLHRQKTHEKHVTPLSLIGVGGSPHVPLEILTGHIVRKHGCEKYRTPKDEHGASAADLTALRDDLKSAFAEKRLVVGGNAPIGKQAIVKGLYYNHSYGVLDYDEKTDTVLFWNPFGNTYKPSGPDGLEFGYTTVNGKFRVPLAQAVMWFGAFSIETNEKAEK